MFRALLVTRVVLRVVLAEQAIVAVEAAVCTVPGFGAIICLRGYRAGPFRRCAPAGRSVAALG